MKQIIRISTVAQSTIVGVALLILTAGSTLAAETKNPSASTRPADQTSVQPTPPAPASPNQSSCGCCKKMMGNMQGMKPMPGMNHPSAPQ